MIFAVISYFNYSWDIKTYDKRKYFSVQTYWNLRTLISNMQCFRIMSPVTHRGCSWLLSQVRSFHFQATWPTCLSSAYKPPALPVPFHFTACNLPFFLFASLTFFLNMCRRIDQKGGSFSYKVKKCWHNVFSDSRVSGHWHGCAANVLPHHENVNSHNCIFIINQRYM